MDSVLSNNINRVFDVTANWMVLRRQFLVGNQYPTVTHDDSNTARTHWPFRPATRKNDRRPWSVLPIEFSAAPRPAGADRVLSRGLIGRVTEPRLGVGTTITPTVPTRVSAHAGYGRCRRTWDDDRAHDTKVLCT